MQLVQNPVFYFLVFLLYVECSPIISTTRTCDSEYGCSGTMSTPLSIISTTMTTTAFKASSAPTATLKFPWPDSVSDTKIEASVHQAKVHEHYQPAVDRAKPTIQTDRISNAPNSIVNNVDNMDANDETHIIKEQIKYEGGLDTVETVAISVVGMLAVAGIGLGLLIWRKSVTSNEEESLSHMVELDKDSFEGQKYPVQIIKAPLDAFKDASQLEEGDIELNDGQYETQTFNKQALLQLDKHFSRFKVTNSRLQSTEAAISENQPQHHISIPLRLQKKYFSASNLTDLSPTSFELDNNGQPSQTEIATSMSIREEEELERTREYFQGFEAGSFNLTLLEQKLFDYEPSHTSSDQVFDPRLEEGLLRPFTAIDPYDSAGDDTDDSGSPLAHYLRKFLAPPPRDSNTDASINKIEVDLYGCIQSDGLTVAENTELQLLNLHHFLPYSDYDSQTSSPSSSYHEFFKDSKNRTAESKLDDIKEMREWMDKRAYYIERYGPPQTRKSTDVLQQNTSDSSEAKLEAASTSDEDADNRDI